MRPGAPYNLLRPEAVEAFFYMWRATRDWRYRAWGWEVFAAFQEHCRVRGGGGSGRRAAGAGEKRMGGGEGGFKTALG